MKLFSYISITILVLVSSIKVKAQAIDTVCAFTNKSTKVYSVAPTPGSTYYWSVECGKIISGNVHTDSIEVAWCNVPGIYQLKVIEKNKAGCWGDTVRTWIMVNGKLNLMLAGPSDICEGQPAMLQAEGAEKYLWNTGETSSTIFPRPQDTIIKYTVIGYNTCETDTASISVKVHPRPKADFTYKPKKPMANEDVFFHYTGKGANQWTWFFGDKNSLSGTVTDPQISFNEKGDKIVTLVSQNDAGCTDTMTYKLHVGYESKIFVPNVFTPNGDEDNDYFKAVGFNLKTINMKIFNRWGEQIFESNHLDDAWDGTFKGEKVMEGVYLYMIDAEATDGEHYYLSGNVTLLR